MDDKALLFAIARGEVEVALEGYSRLVSLVESTLHRVLGCWYREHDVFVRRSLESVVAAIAAHPHPWVCRLEFWASACTARVALDALRSRSRGSLEPMRREALTQASGERQIGIERLRRLIGELSPRQAEVVVLHDVLGLAITHVAITTGISLEDANGRLARGREWLRVRLAAPSVPVAEVAPSRVAVTQ